MYGTMIESMLKSKSEELDEEAISVDSMDIAYQLLVDSDLKAKPGKQLLHDRIVIVVMSKW